MLSTLDPHSSFFDPREYAQMRERQEGHYYGIGIQISAVDGDIIAQLVFEGSPAHKQGVRQGDVIARHRRRRHQGLERTPIARGDEEAARRARHAGADFAPAPRLRAADPRRARARRNHDPDRAGRFHDRRDDRATCSCAISARTPIAICGARCRRWRRRACAGCCSTSATTPAARSTRRSRSSTSSCRAAR